MNVSPNGGIGVQVAFSMDVLKVGASGLCDDNRGFRHPITHLSKWVPAVIFVQPDNFILIVSIHWVNRGILNCARFEFF